MPSTHRGAFGSRLTVRPLGWPRGLFSRGARTRGAGTVFGFGAAGRRHSPRFATRGIAQSGRIGLFGPPLRPACALGQSVADNSLDLRKVQFKLVASTARQIGLERVIFSHHRRHRLSSGRLSRHGGAALTGVRWRVGGRSCRSDWWPRSNGCLPGTERRNCAGLAIGEDGQAWSPQRTGTSADLFQPPLLRLLAPRNPPPFGPCCPSGCPRRPRSGVPLGLTPFGARRRFASLLRAVGGMVPAISKETFP
jgi:hypothetical protein